MDRRHADIVHSSNTRSRRQAVSALIRQGAEAGSTQNWLRATFGRRCDSSSSVLRQSLQSKAAPLPQFRFRKLEEDHAALQIVSAASSRAGSSGARPLFGDGVFFGDELVLDITELMQGGTEKDRMEIQDVFPGPNDSDGYEQALVKRYCAGPVPGPVSHKVCTEAPLVPGPSPP